jgi:hypothetical protein
MGYCAENGKSNAKHNALFSFQSHSGCTGNLDDITGHDLKKEHQPVFVFVTSS